MSTRRARVRALAKINLDLRVLGKRPDGYHELRTIFQTISLADTLEVAFTPGRKTAVEIEDGAIDDCQVKTADGLRAEPFVWIPDVAAAVRARQHRIPAMKSPLKVCF